MKKQSLKIVQKENLIIKVGDVWNTGAIIFEITDIEMLGEDSDYADVWVKLPGSGVFSDWDFSIKVKTFKSYFDEGEIWK